MQRICRRIGFRVFARVFMSLPFGYGSAREGSGKGLQCEEGLK